MKLDLTTLNLLREPGELCTPFRNILDRLRESLNLRATIAE